MATTIDLPATSRDERGSHNKPLRREGQVPAVLYGHNVEPRAIVTQEPSCTRCG